MSKGERSDARPCVDPLAPYRWLLGEKEPELVCLEAGEVLVRGGEKAAEPLAWLVLEGEVEERMTAYLPGHGMVEQPLFLASAGDLVNAQALVPGYRDQPALCSLHVVSDGWAATLDAENLPSSSAVFDAFFRRSVEFLEREKQMLGLYGGVVSLFQNSPEALPFVPADPHQLIQRLIRALEERGYLEGRGPNSAASHRLHSLEEANTSLKDRLERMTKALNTALGQCRTLEQRWDFENRARAALERRLNELMQRVVEKPEESPLSSRFPHAVTVLESKEVEELERSARRYQKLADQFEYRANRLHRAIELLERDNPGMIIAEDVMMLMLGEEPPDRDEADQDIAVSGHPKE